MAAIFWTATLVLFATLFVDPIRDDVVGLNFTRFLFWGLPCAGLLYVSLQRTQTWLQSAVGRMAVQFGNGSYSIYIFQIFSLPALANMFRWLKVDRVLPIDALVLLLAALSILTGYAGYLIIERPFSAAAKIAIGRVLQRDSERVRP
jgi:peptidoglycan/LPS O-acetylase OafA/YrhL